LKTLAISSDESCILEQIRALPYYSVRIRPAHELAAIDPGLLRHALGESGVRLRGWDFPHFDPNAIYNTPSYLGTTVDWSQHVELWRMYRSGQFVYLGGLWDVAMDFQARLRAEFDSGVFLVPPGDKESVRGVLSFVGAIYSVTEFYLFAARLSKELEYASDVRLHVSLHNVEGWALATGEPGVPWHSFYQSKIKQVPLPTPSPGELATDPAAAAAVGLKEMFMCFNWSSAEGAIKHYQEKFIAGRFAF
jgi:hypothetical protein